MNVYNNVGTLYYFFFNDTATTEIYTLSLHDALPISRSERLSFSSAYFFHAAHKLSDSTNKGFSFPCHKSGPIKKTLSRNFSCNVLARVDKTVYIPPTLLHTSQLASKM